MKALTAHFHVRVESCPGSLSFQCGFDGVLLGFIEAVL